MKILIIVFEYQQVLSTGFTTLGIVTGVDGSSQALKLISSGTNLKATMSQDFDGMVEIIVNDVTDLLNGEKIETGEKYAPAKMVTSADKS